MKEREQVRFPCCFNGVGNLFLSAHNSYQVQVITNNVEPTAQPMLERASLS